MGLYNELNTYLDARVTQANSTISGTANDFVKIDAGLDPDQLPENQKHNRYMLKITKYDDKQFESPTFDIELEVELKFLIPNNDTVKYKTVIDDYVHLLVRCIYDTPKHVNAGNTFSFECTKVGASELNNFGSDSTEGEYSPKINITGIIVDQTTLGLSVPSAPTLTAPTNGSTSGVLDQSFNWTGTADTWDIKIYIGSTIVIYQGGLTLSSFTVPLDNLLTDATLYSWTVRGNNSAGTGDWATPFTFTTNDSNLPETPVLDQPTNGETETSLTVLFLWATSLRALTYEIQIATDSGFSSLLTTVTGLDETYYSYTFSSDNTYYWRVRATNGSGSSSYTSGRSVIVDAPVPDYTTGLIRDWSADSLITSDENGISAWLDSIGSLSASQSNNTNKPKLATNFINGHNAVIFNNTNHYLTFTPETWSTYTVYVVYKAISFSAGDADVMIGGTAGDIYSAINVTNGGYGVGNGSVFRDVPYSAGDTNWHIRAFQALKLYSDGTEAGSYAHTGNPASITVGTIGKRSAGAFPAEVYIARIRVYNTVHNGATELLVDNYLNSLYATH